MYFFNLNTGAAFQQVGFLNNSAGLHGGGVVLSTANAGISFVDCEFADNTSGGTAGAVRLDNANGVGVLAAGNEVVFEG